MIKKWILRVVYFIAILALMILPVFPTTHDFSDVERIEIEVSDYLSNDDWPNKKWMVSQIGDSGRGRYLRVLDTQEDISALEQMLGTTWDGAFPQNSHERKTLMAEIIIHREGEKKECLLFTERQWGKSGKTDALFLEKFRNLMR